MSEALLLAVRQIVETLAPLEPLHAALSSPTAVRSLQEASSQDQVTPLTCAVEAGHLEIVDLLLRQGANPDVATCKGARPLHLAAFSGNLDVLRRLLQAKVNVNSDDRHGQTPIFFAADADVCSTLFAASADLDLRNRKGQSALHTAAHAGLDGVLEWLVKHVKPGLINATDKHGRTAFYVAKHAGFTSAAAILKSHGANARIKPHKPVHSSHPKPDAKRSSPKGSKTPGSPQPKRKTAEVFKAECHSPIAPSQRTWEPLSPEAKQSLKDMRQTSSEEALLTAAEAEAEILDVIDEVLSSAMDDELQEDLYFPYSPFGPIRLDVDLKRPPPQPMGWPFGYADYPSPLNRPLHLDPPPPPRGVPLNLFPSVSKSSAFPRSPPLSRPASASLARPTSASLCSPPLSRPASASLGRSPPPSRPASAKFARSPPLSRPASASLARSPPLSRPVSASAARSQTLPRYMAAETSHATAEGIKASSPFADSPTHSSHSRPASPLASQPILQEKPAATAALLNTLLSNIPEAPLPPAPAARTDATNSQQQSSTPQSSTPPPTPQSSTPPPSRQSQTSPPAPLAAPATASPSGASNSFQVKPAPKAQVAGPTGLAKLKPDQLYSIDEMSDLGQTMDSMKLENLLNLDSPARSTTVMSSVPSMTPTHVRDLQLLHAASAPTSPQVQNVLQASAPTSPQVRDLQLLNEALEPASPQIEDVLQVSAPTSPQVRDLQLLKAALASTSPQVQDTSQAVAPTSLQAPDDEYGFIREDSDAVDDASRAASKVAGEDLAEASTRPSTGVGTRPSTGQASSEHWSEHPRLNRAGFMAWQVLIEKLPGQQLGLLHTSGKVLFNYSRQTSAVSQEGPEVLVALAVKPSGCLEAWNFEHNDSKIQPCDRICEINGRTGIKEMQGELRKSNVLRMKLLRYPVSFNVNLLPRDGLESLGIQLASDLRYPEQLLISEVLPGRVEDRNQRNIAQGMYHLVVMPGMRIQAVNGFRGSSQDLASRLNGADQGPLQLTLQRSEDGPRLAEELRNSLKSAYPSVSDSSYGLKESSEELRQESSGPAIAAPPLPGSLEEESTTTRVELPKSADARAFDASLRSTASLRSAGSFIGETTSRLRSAATIQFQAPAAPAAIAIPPGFKQLLDGRLQWSITLEKATPTARLGLGHFNGADQFQKARGELPTAMGPPLLVVGKIAPEGLLADWNRLHEGSEVAPGDRIAEVNGASTPEEMQQELSGSSNFVMRLMRYPATFQVRLQPLSANGQRRPLGIQFERSGPSALRITAISPSGLVEEYNQFHISQERFHLVVTVGMLIVRANHAQGAVDQMAMVLSTASLLQLLIRRVE